MTAFPGKYIGMRPVDRNVEYEDGLAAGLRRAAPEENPAPIWSVAGARWEAGRRVALGLALDDLVDTP